MSQNLTFENLVSFEKNFREDRANRIAMAAVTSSGITAASANPEAFRSELFQYSLKLDQGEITNQERSGRCWMFSALNTIRYRVIRKLNLETFELSQAYTLFYDKLEKARKKGITSISELAEYFDLPEDFIILSHYVYKISGKI